MKVYKTVQKAVTIFKKLLWKRKDRNEMELFKKNAITGSVRSLQTSKKFGMILRKRTSSSKFKKFNMARFYLIKRFQKRLMNACRVKIISAMTVKKFMKNSAKRFGSLMISISHIWDCYMVEKIEWESYKERDKQDRFYRERLIKLEKSIKQTLYQFKNKRSSGVLKGDHLQGYNSMVHIAKKLKTDKNFIEKQGFLLVRDWYNDKYNKKKLKEWANALNDSEGQVQNKIYTTHRIVQKNIILGGGGGGNQDDVIYMMPGSKLLEYIVDCRECSVLPYTKLSNFF